MTFIVVKDAAMLRDPVFSEACLVGSKSKQWKLDDVLNILATGFLKGGTGFLKSSAAGEMIKGGGSVNREIRVGITHVSVVHVCRPRMSVRS